jgi:hypothetical protein
MKLVVFVSLITIISLAATVVVGAASNDPLTISFTKSPPKEINNLQTYSPSISWTNTAKKNYEGYFLITIKNDQSSIKSSDLKLSYQGINIQPQVSGNTLTFMLPKMTFLALKQGVVSFQVNYYNPATYSLQAIVVKT